MTQATQFFIEGTLVTCTVFNATGLGFYASETATSADVSDLSAAMTIALAAAETSRDSFTSGETS